MKLNIKKETLKKIGIVAGVFLGCWLIVLIITDIVLMPIATRQGDDTQVPDVIELSQQAAEAKIKEADLGVVIGGEEYDPRRPKGTVINQTPDAGSKVKTGRRVVLTLSKGSASATVPAMSGYTLREARLLLEREGLQPGSIVWYTDDTKPDGVIIGSIPVAGTVMRLNAQVQLLVNRVETDMAVAVPNFVGMDLDKARVLAEENYLQIGDLNYATNDDMLPETVMSQSLLPGQSVKKWSTINLTISATE
jgi:eukaryotic-like serine/threonine-protein kinase